MPATFNTGLPAVKGLALQCCKHCQHINYPARELCGNCLEDALAWQSVSSAGTVQSLSDLHYPLESNFTHQLPWRIASVKLDVGPVAFAHLQPGVRTGERVALEIVEDKTGNRMLVAIGNRQSATRWLKSVHFEEVTA